MPIEVNSLTDTGSENDASYFNLLIKSFKILKEVTDFMHYIVV